MKGQTFILLAVAFLLPIASLQADEVDDLIDALKPSPLDYAVWAESLLKAGQDLGSKPDVQVRVYRRTYEYGLKKANGYPTAIQAAQALLKADPDQKAAWQWKLLTALKLDWQGADRKRKKEAGRTYVEQLIALADDLAASGDASEAIKLYTDASRMTKYYAPDRRDEVVQKLKDTREQQQLQEQAERCRRVLVENPKNVAVRERLIRLYVVDFDNPAEAQKLLTADVSERLRTYVPLAAKKTEEVAKDACLELGDWYRSLAARATSGSKGKALTRAWTYYELLVKLETDPVKAAAGKAKLAQVAKKLAQAGSLPPNLRRGLALYYDFDKDGGRRVTDKSGKGNHGAATGAKWTRNGKVGGAYQFDGKKDHIRSEEPLAHMQFSFAVWLLNESALRKRAILQAGSNWRVVGEDGAGEAWLDGRGIEFGLIRPRIGTGVVYSDTKQWLHLAGTHDGATIRLYLNGQLRDTASVGGHRFSDSHVLVGRKLEGDFFCGILDEIMVWNRALSEDEVKQVYGLTRGK